MSHLGLYFAFYSEVAGGQQPTQNWVASAVRNVLHPIILIIVAVGTAFAAASFVSEAFRRYGNSVGIRAVAAAFFPLVAVTAVLHYSSGALPSLGWPGGVASLLVGFFFHLVYRLRGEWAPVIGAFGASAIFSALLLDYAASRDSNIVWLYYGYLIGVLARIAIFGVPKTVYRFVSPVGTFEIKPAPRNQAGLFFDGALLNTFESAPLAAEDLDSHRTGAAVWDRHREYDPPCCLEKWEVIRR